MGKLDYKKEYKDLYMPKNMPVLIDVPEMPFIMVDGKGAPGGEEYQNAISLLYSLTFTIKMKGKNADGYFDYVVPPLEGLWWCAGRAFDFGNRDAWHWTSMIRQPEFVTPALYAWAAEEAARKKPELDYSKVRLEQFTEGLCVQMMHIGPYADEPATVDAITTYIEENHLADLTKRGKRHHEIYLSDPNKAKPENLKTVIRYPVAKK